MASSSSSAACECPSVWFASGGTSSTVVSCGASGTGSPTGPRRPDVRNRALAADYLRRAAVRLRAVDVLFEGASWADVVRESQEVVELALKGLLRQYGVDAPRIHDVSAVLLAEITRLPPSLHPEVPRLAALSRALRRDRELAFYGAEDLTPSTFYSKDDASRALEGARTVVRLAGPLVVASE